MCFSGWCDCCCVCTHFILRTPITLESNVMLSHLVACILSVNHVASKFLFQLRPGHLVTIIHVHVIVLCPVDMSIRETYSILILKTLGQNSKAWLRDDGYEILRKTIDCDYRFTSELRDLLQVVWKLITSTHLFF